MTKRPISYNFSNKKAVVIGGGSIGAERAKKLNEYGAKVTLITLENKSGLTEFTVIKKKYDYLDLVGQEIVVAATNNESLNEQIVEDALKLKIPLVNSVTKCSATTFSFPALIEKEDIRISIDTGGNSPAFTKILKGKIMDLFDSTLLEHYEVLKNARDKIKRIDNDHQLIKDLGKLSTEEIKMIMKDYD